MKPIQELTQLEAQGLAGVLFDLDDTLLDHGKLSETAYQALFRLRDCGLRLIAVTGRPASWADLVCRMWPLEAALGENGAIAYVTTNGRIRMIDNCTTETRTQRHAALAALAAEALRRFPALTPADDVSGRLTDFTFDIGEHQKVSEDIIRAARDFAHDAGARTTRSSVHLHYTFDQQDKATGALGYFRRLDQDPTLARQKFAFIGDSENDASCFAGFATTVAVQNLRGHFSIPPRYITKNPTSSGFIEFAEVLSQRRKS